MRHQKVWTIAGAVAVATVAGAALSLAQTRPDNTPRDAAGAPIIRPGIAAFAAPPRSRLDWQGAVGGLRQSGGASESLGANLDRAEVDRTAVPILLPRDAKLTAGARIYSFGDYYTITADTAGGGVSLSGTTAIVPLPTNKPLKIEDGPEMLTVQRTVDGQLASFVRYGVLYTVEIRCDAPTDPRCADDNYVLGLVGKTSAVVMGAAARAAAGLGG
ncbi:hypothetical protein [Caulobacter sp. RHG1]|uniref:hypothetical protein n=1 Tax=Caulobacter sp. (strain RHG1) TaxID=2545762 RepID=UPI0015551FE9|nr:hypothetical protein [Caulobacter sp. RHG1]NQE62831.1 hypothetical protein [Caulobacter sp. RHG1]